MKRFVIVSQDDLIVTKIIEKATSLEAHEECVEQMKGGLRAIWIKAECIEDVAEKDPYVKIKLLQDQLKELKGAAPVEEPKPAAKWSNGRLKK